ncbi:MAG: PAS domain S-box protein [Clostridia bacterium BRH_c25]|nr:MAG: PAS domain S-box protein [Clostridia bacterium BRH_c25]
MSEIINNREYRQKMLKDIIMELHAGKTVEEVKARFEELIKDISATEISEMEQALIMDGMPVEEIQRLCDVHAAVFKGSIEEIHKVQKPEETPGHPIHTFRLENRELEKHINEKLKPHLEEFKGADSKENIYKLLEDVNLLLDIDKHYSRKENLLFPYMEKYGITAPPKVMWGVDDEIRAAIKEVKAKLQNYNGEKEEIYTKADKAANRVVEMIFKEENILFPMVMETLSEDEWLIIEGESDEIGYCLVGPQGKWKPSRTDVEEKQKETGQTASDGYLKFETGLLTAKEIGLIFNNLPLDITYVDKDGAVKYFSQGKERIFPRTKAIIGRQVHNCHPPASVHIVEKLVEDFKAGRKDSEGFWIKMGGMFVYIRYFAIRDEKGDYAGTLEVTQNIKPIQEISGEKRLVSE